MPRIRIEVEGFRCARCGHEWVPRKDETPRVCPKCKSPFWDRERSILAYRADVLAHGEGWPPDRKKLEALERQLGKTRRPSVRTTGKGVRLSFDVRAATEGNAQTQAKAILGARAKSLGLWGPRVKAEIRVTRLPTD